MKKDVFNTKGDFITSPEISQMFGEMIGVWCLSLLGKINAIDLDNLRNRTSGPAKKKYGLLEFGPGRGTLMIDIIRVLHQFGLLNGLEINFVEASPFLRKIQQERITKQLQKYDIWMKYDYDESKKSKVERFTSENPDFYLNLRWFTMYEQYLFEDFGDLAFREFRENDPNNTPVLVLQHEFIDALPVHMFQFSREWGWCEKLVNVCHDYTKQRKFEYILTDGPNENVKKFLKPEETFSEEVRKTIKHGDTVEVCPKALVMTNSISELIAKTNGGALIIDYGENHALSDSVRGIRSHKYIPQDHLLEYPGEADLSAYVNFQALAHVARKTPNVQAYGPIPQGLFLESMGMNTRLEALWQVADSETRKRLESEYLRLVSPDEMGEIYKVMYIGRESTGEVFPFIEQNEPQVFY